MINEIFSIDKFNVISDDDNYYFFRALNNGDNKDIETREILDTDNNIIRIRTDRERYIGETTYTDESIISLEEVNDHVKWGHSYDTNCISLTTNANVACMFGREYYNDTYVIVKIPKEELNKSVFCSGLYLINEINKKIENMINNNELSISQINYINRINNINSKEELELIKKELLQESVEEVDYFNNGIKFNVTNSREYVGLSEKQDLEKNKLILKLDIINKNIIPYFSNRRLIETVKLGFSSSEFIHYKDINGEKIRFINKELVDVWALVQQLPSNISFLDDLKKELLFKTYNIKLNGSFEYKDFNVSESDLTIENIFNITNGQVNYQKAIEMYDKSFYYAKSKLRALNSIELLKKLVDYNPKYNEIIEYLNIKAFGVEPKITTRFENNRVNLSEAVSLNFKPSEQLLFNYLEHQNVQSLNEIIINSNETLKKIISVLVFEEDIIINNKEEYYANAIIDLFNWKKLGIERLYPERKNEIIEQLLKCDIVNIYNNFKNSGIKETQISNVLLTNIIKVSIYMEDLKLNDKEYNDIFIKLINNRISNLNINETFTLEELEWFLGYNKVIDTNLKLFEYQRPIVNNITKTLKQRRYTSAIIPTGTGKSYISLYELHLHKDEELLYVAPNKEILNQLKRIIIEVYNPEKHAGESNNDLVKKVFPNLTLTTYQDMQDKIEEDKVFKEYGFKEKILKKEYQKKYNFIICDELHRTGATGWQGYMEMLFSYQDEYTKVLGVTATPERDRDDKDMSEYWAKYFGYSDEEILKGMHQAVNMDIVEAIKKRIIANPKVINCEYSLISDGSMDELKLSIENIMDEDFKVEEMKKYEELRRNVENSDGIEKILHDNLEQDSKYIVFLPVTKKNDGSYEDEFGNKVDKSTAERVIKDYQVLMRQYLFSHNYLTDENNRVKELYNKIKNNICLTNEELLYLTYEKEYILLLSKIDIQYKPSALNTETNMIADTIINYMNWGLLDVKIRNKRLKELTNDLVEDYSMLGSYDDR